MITQLGAEKCVSRGQAGGPFWQQAPRWLQRLTPMIGRHPTRVISHTAAAMAMIAASSLSVRSIGMRGLARLQPAVKYLAGLEEWNVFLADRDIVTGARVAADVGVALSNRERAETAQLDSIAM
jgi:hypothetical protein